MICYKVYILCIKKLLVNICVLFTRGSVHCKLYLKRALVIFFFCADPYLIKAKRNGAKVIWRNENISYCHKLVYSSIGLNGISMKSSLIDKSAPHFAVGTTCLLCFSFNCLTWHIIYYMHYISYVLSPSLSPGSC